MRPRGWNQDRAFTPAGRVREDQAARGLRDVPVRTVRDGQPDLSGAVCGRKAWVAVRTAAERTPPMGAGRAVAGRGESAAAPRPVAPWRPAGPALAPVPP